MAPFGPLLSSATACIHPILVQGVPFTLFYPFVEVRTCESGISNYVVVYCFLRKGSVLELRNKKKCSKKLPRIRTKLINDD